MAIAPSSSGSSAQHIANHKNDDPISFAPKKKQLELKAEPEPATSAIDAVQAKPVVNSSGQITGTKINTKA